MYIQITTRCNMECAHCCYSCGPEGVDMDRQTFLAACKLAAEYGENISIGGGEPTVHPLFWDFIGLAIAYTDEGPPWLATNGKLTETALILARLARKGVLSVELSQDEFHEEIEWDVVEAFQKPKRGSTTMTR